MNTNTPAPTPSEPAPRRWGLGSILQLQQQPDRAVYHFQRAARISPRNPVLQCHLGMALRDAGRSPEALRGLLEAERMRPRDPMIKFQVAGLFRDQGDLQVRPSLRGCAVCREPWVLG